jgi:dihydroorotate dehydrogenase (fumarate)
MESPADSFAEALSYFPTPQDFRLGPHEYLDRVREVKDVVSCPVIASLNGTTVGGWLRYASLIEEAGADALELNVYELVTDPTRRAEEVEANTLDMVREIKSAIRIPVAVKLSPFYTALANFASRLDSRGAAGLVLFNRFYQPDIDIEELEVIRSLRLSNSSELLLRLRWLAILRGKVKGSLAISGGVHTVEDAVKAVMCGADVVQLVSSLLRNGPEHLAKLRTELVRWLEEHEYHSLEQLRGSMSLQTCPDPSAFERANYLQILQSWRP